MEHLENTLDNTENFEEIMIDNQEEIQKKEADFFSKKFYYSYSSLNKLLWNPKVFYQMYVLGIREERTEAHLIQGKLIHTLLLEPENLLRDFVLSPTTLPTGNMKTVVDRVFNKYKGNQEVYDSMGKTGFQDFSSEILDVMREINYHQALKTDQQRIDKVVTSDTQNYWTFLKDRGQRTLIDQATLSFCKNAVELIMENDSILELLGQNVTEFDNVEVKNELFMQVDLKGKSFGLKGIIDNLVIKHDEKMILINDIKTTSKDLKDFPESVEYYGYWMQAVIYSIMVVNWLCKDHIDNGYDLQFNFVVIDRAFQTYAFTVSEDKMKEWFERFEEMTMKAQWHFDNKDYSLPYEFANGLVSL